MLIVRNIFSQQVGKRRVMGYCSFQSIAPVTFGRRQLPPTLLPLGVLAQFWIQVFDFDPTKEVHGIRLLLAELAHLLPVVLLTLQVVIWKRY